MPIHCRKLEFLEDMIDYMGCDINKPPTRHILGLKDVVSSYTDRQDWSTGATRGRDKQTKKRKSRKPNSDKLAIRRDHPCRRMEMPFSTVRGPRAVVVSFKFHQNRSVVSDLWGLKIAHSHWPVAYTTVCTVQAVTSFSCCRWTARRTALHP